MTDTAHAEVEITNRPQRPGLSYMPPVLIEHFHAQQHRVRWGSKHSTKLAMAGSVGWFRVELRKLPGPVRAAIKESGFVLEGDGFIYHGDWVLQTRSLKAHEQDEAEIARQKAEFESPTYALDQAGDAVDRVRSEASGIGRASGLLPGREVVFGTQESPQAATTGSAKLSPDVIAAVQEGLKNKEKK